MSTSELTSLSATQIADIVRQGSASPLAIVEAHLAQVERLNPLLNAFVQVDAERALEQARQAEQAVAWNRSRGLLQGVPVSIKSSIEVAGLRCEAGTRIRAGHVAHADAPLVERLRAAGAIVLGTTNTPEFLMAWETDNLLYGRTNNPWDLSRTSGGSSGGEAAAIAAGCSAGGVGSDGGGSIRVPAHFCGICGLKPTPGRIPATGHYPQSVGPFALLGVVGPMARTISDLKLLFEVLQGPDFGDPSATPVPVRWPEWSIPGRSSIEGSQAGVDARLYRQKPRIGFFEDDGRTPVTAETRAAVRQAAQLLRDAGFEVESFCPDGLEKAAELWWKFFGGAGAMLLGPLLNGQEAELSPILKEFNTWVEKEPPHTAQSLLNAWIQRDMVRMLVFEQIKRFPVLLCPVASVPAFKHGERSWQIEGKAVHYLDAWTYCEWFNLLGMPGVVVPMLKSTEGLPIGVQIVTQPWEEELALSVAEVLENQRGAWQGPPFVRAHDSPVNG